MPRKLLVTGGAGFIGSCFVELAHQKGYQIIVLDSLTYAGQRENLSHMEVELVVGQIQNPSLVRELLKQNQIDAVVHLAAESHVDRSIEGPSIFIETNIVGTSVLLSESLEYYKSLKAQKRDSFRYIQVSTDEVYGSLGPVGKFSEISPYAPNSPYSASKAAADHLVRAWFHTYGLPTITTHCSNNYGPRQHPEKLIPTMISSALSGKQLPVYGDGENIRDWIHVEDHCQGLLKALELGRPGETYCFGGDAERKNIELVKTICATLDELAPRKKEGSYLDQIEFVRDRLGHDRRYAIDDSLAQRELGFKRKKQFESGMRETIEWYLKRHSK